MAVTSTTLGQACTLKAGKFIAANDIVDEYRDGLFPCYGGNGIRGYVTEYSHEGAYPLIGRQGALCGNVNFASGKFRATEHAVVVQPNVQMNVRWLYYKLLSMNLGQYATGAAQPGLAVAKLEQLSFSMPSLEEQDRLSTLCDDVESLISLRKQQIAKLDELVKFRFIELFGDPVQNPKKWIQKPFGAICENLDSHRVPITSTDRKAGQFPYYGASGIVDYVNDYIFDENLLLVSEDGANLLMRSTPIAFSISGKTWVNNHAHVLRFGSMALQKYIEVCFSMIDISGSITGTAQPKLNQAKLNEMLFSIPPESLIEGFYAFLTQTDKSKLTIQHSLAKLELLKKKLMQKYFG